MSMISEQINKLREAVKSYRPYVPYYVIGLLHNAADTIESLSAKLEKANKELERWHTDKVNDKIKNPFAWTSTLCCHNCDHKDEYIEELEASDIERSAEDCGGGWILCSERMPEENEEVICCFKSGVVKALVLFNCKFHGKVYAYEKSDIIAWQPLPEPYHEP